MRIFFGAVDIGWRIELYKRFLEERIKPLPLIRSFVKFRVNSTQYQTKYDLQIQYKNYPTLIQWFISFVIFFYALIRFDTFYFLSGETILTRKLIGFELKMCRLFRKKVIMHFVGSDIRNLEYTYWKENNITSYINGIDFEPKSNAWQKQLVSLSNQFADSILVSTPDLLEIAPNAVYYPVMLDLKKFNIELDKAKKNPSKFFKTNKVKILHAPSNSKIKGSDIICNAIKELSKETDQFEFIYTKDLNIDTGSKYTVSRYELFQLYAETDIVIDQLTIGWYGLQSIEAIAANCTVMCYIDQKVQSHLFEECPIIATDSIHLKDDILKLLQEYRKPNLENNQAWIKKYHTIEKNNSILIDSILN
jgi:hypothetical protein